MFFKECLGDLGGLVGLLKEVFYGFLGFFYGFSRVFLGLPGFVNFWDGLGDGRSGVGGWGWEGVGRVVFGCSPPLPWVGDGGMGWDERRE